MLDTRGPELVVLGYDKQHPIALTAGDNVRIRGAPSAEVVPTPVRRGNATADAPATAYDTTGKAYPLATAECLTVNWPNVTSSVPIGTQVFIAPYLYTGSETSSAYLEVVAHEGDCLVCKCLNDTVLGGARILTVMVSGVQAPLPTLTAQDEHDIVVWGKRNRIDFLSLSFTRDINDVLHARSLLERNGMDYVQLIPKIESITGLREFDSILAMSDGIVFSRGNLGIDVPAEKMFRCQKHVIRCCNEAGKPVVITRVVDTMVNAPRPTRAEATDVANAVLDGADAILLGAETTRGSHPVLATKTLVTICEEAQRMFDHNEHYIRTMDVAAGGSAASSWNRSTTQGEDISDEIVVALSDEEALASSAVRAADKSGASLIVCYTRTGNTARLLAKYKPPVPVLTYVVPTLYNDGLRWQFKGDSVARQMLLQYGLVPMLADPSIASEEALGNDSASGPLLDEALNYAMEQRLCKSGDTIVVSQKLGLHPVVKVLSVD